MVGEGVGGEVVVEVVVEEVVVEVAQWTHRILKYQLQVVS